MNENLPYDDIFKQKLSEHESAVPEDMFDRLMHQRDARDVAADKIFKYKLGSYESIVPTGMFERIMGKRIGSAGEPVGDKIIQDKLTAYESTVPFDMFDSLMYERETRLPSSDIILKHRLTEHESEVPSDMFERIMGERDKRRPVVFWWQTNRFRGLMACLLLALLVGGYKYMSGFNFNKTDNTVNTSENKTSENASQLAPKDSYTEGVSTTTASSQVNSAAIQNSSEKNEKTTNYNINQKNITKNDLNGKISDDHSSVNNESHFNKKSNLNYQAKTQRGSNVAASTTTVITSNSSQPNVSVNNLGDNKLASQANDISIPNASLTDVQHKASLELRPLSKVSGKGIAYNPLKHEDLVNALPCPGPDYGCPTFGKKNAGKMLWYVDAYVAPEYALRSLKALSTEFNDYRNARDTIEKTLYAFGGGVRATAMFQNGISLRGGLVYSQNNERFKKDSVIQRIQYVTNFDPATGISDTIKVNLLDIISRKIRYNRYRTLDFTIQAGYEYPLTDALTIGLNAGVNINILTAIKATVLGQDYMPYDLSKSSTIYQTSVGTSLVGSVAGYWRISDKLQLMVEPQVRYFMRPITKADYVLRQSYVNAGLNIGVRYRLF